MEDNILSPMDWFNQYMNKNQVSTNPLYSQFNASQMLQSIAPSIMSGSFGNIPSSSIKAPNILSGLKGGIEGVKSFNAIKNLGTTAADASKAAKAITGASGFAGATANSGFGAALKGFTSGMGGVTGVGGALVAAGNLLPGAKVDYQSKAGKILQAGSTAAGLAGTLGAGAALGPIGLGLSALVLANNLAGKKAASHKVGADALTGTGSSYTGLSQDIGAAGKKFDFLGRGKANKVSRNVKMLDSQRSVASQIGYKNSRNTIGAQNSTQDILNKNKQSRLGVQGTNILAAKSGLKFRELKSIVYRAKQKKIDQNVIPSGALHARKHDLPDEIKEHVTDKGIPVISYEGDGGIVQHAEIENSEIIFTKNVTDKFEELLKKFKDGDSEAAIEAGKLLEFEILENTIDNVGLLNS